MPIAFQCDCVCRQYKKLPAECRDYFKKITHAVCHALTIHEYNALKKQLEVIGHTSKATSQ